MTELKRNHFIPQFILRAWASAGPKYTGVWVYEIEKAKKYFSDGSGGGAFSFAMDNDLYVPRLAGVRAPAMEKWFSQLEGSLSLLVRQAANREAPITMRSESDWVAATMGLFGLEVRSRYHVRRLRQAIASDPSLRTFLSDDPERGEHQLALENIIQQVSDLTQRYTPIELIFEFSAATPLILSDRPFFNAAGLPHRFVVLTKDCFVAYARSSRGTSRYKAVDASPDLVGSVNEQVALNARDWIIAATEAQLDKYVAVVTSDAWKKRIEGDRIEAVHFEQPRPGWTIAPPE